MSYFFSSIAFFLQDLTLFFVKNMPGKTGNFFRSCFYKLKLKHLGKNVIISEGVAIYHPEFVCIQDNCIIGRFSTIDTGYELSRGQQESREDFYPEREVMQKEKCNIYIEKNVVIGERSYIFGSSGVYIYEGTTLATPNVRIHSETHMPYIKNDRKMRSSANKLSSLPEAVFRGMVVLGKNVFIASDVLVLPKTFLGDDCCVGTKSTIQGHYDKNTYLKSGATTVREKRFL